VLLPRGDDEAAKRAMVTEARADGVSREPFVQVSPPGPLLGRAIFFDEGLWAPDSFVKAYITEDALEAPARNAVERLLSTTSGLWLVNALSRMFFDRATGVYRSRIELWFVSAIQEASLEECGEFFPPKAGASTYRLQLKNYVWSGETLVAFGDPVPPGGAIARCGDTWPTVLSQDTQAWVRRICYVDDAASMMADCLYHELLHVWFVNGGADRERVSQGLDERYRLYPTGHQSYAAGEYDPDFHAMAVRMIDELNRPWSRELRAIQQASIPE
jgi:hypothetical protein